MADEPVTVEVECPECSNEGPHARLAADERVEQLLCEGCGTVFDIEAWQAVTETEA